MGGLRARCGPAVETSATVPFGRWDAVFSVLAASSAVVLLVLGRSLAPWFDEWRFIDFDGGVAGYLEPFNEHWVALPLLLYRVTLSIFGLHSYLPYLGEVVVLHVGAVAGAYMLIRRRVGPAVATLVAFPLLYLGVGA